MALEELTFESPEYYEREGGRGERRVFQTTDLADIPSRGDTASSPFTAGYRIDSVSRRPGGFDSGSQLYRVTIEAVPIDYFNPEPDVDDGELPVQIGFDVSLESRSVMKKSSTYDKNEGDYSLVVWGEAEPIDYPFFTYSIDKYYDAEGIVDLVSEFQKVGMINDSKNDPFDGAVKYRWMCIGTPAVKINPNLWKITYEYKHCGYPPNVVEDDLDPWNWKQEAKTHGYDNGNDIYYWAYREGTIGPA